MWGVVEYSGNKIAHPLPIYTFLLPLLPGELYNYSVLNHLLSLMYFGAKEYVYVNSVLKLGDFYDGLKIGLKD